MGCGIRPANDRFDEKWEFTMYCWEWTGTVGSVDGGGFWFGPGRGRGFAHVFAYERWVGEVPLGMVVDHICRNRSCVNPLHLRACTQGQNMQNQAATGRKSKSGHRNVESHQGKWRVRVQCDGIRHEGGVFDSLDEAAEAARLLRNELFTHNNEDRR